MTKKSPDKLPIEHVNLGLHLMTTRLRFAHESGQPKLADRGEAAEASGVGARRLANIESGQSDVTYGELLQLARLYKKAVRELIP